MQATQERFAENVFPYMKVDWKTYPDNIGHFYYKGCFRCHDGEHRSESGEKIPHECTTCHRIVAQGSGLRAETETSSAGLKFEHPVNIGGLWQQMACSSCHTGVGVTAEAAARPALPAVAKLAPPAASGLTVEATLSASLRAEVRGSFQKLCVTCHATDGRPDSKMILVMPRIPDFTDPKWQAGHRDADLHHAILMASHRSCLPTRESWDRSARINSSFTSGSSPRAKKRNPLERSRRGVLPRSNLSEQAAA